jgi:predicted metal-binding protein
MEQPVKIGIIICHRYHNCAGGKCFKALKNRDGAFSRYKNREVELVGYTTCDGCPGGNVEFAPDEMKKNGANIIHFATGLVVGYPPCPYLIFFRDFIQKKYGLEVVFGTHPIPKGYFETHTKIGTWKSNGWKDIIKPILTDKLTRLEYS